MTTIPTSSFDAAALRRAYSGRDAESLLAHYADDAKVEIVDAQNMPSKPLRLDGKDAIRGHLEDVLARDMTHEVDVVADGPDAVGYVLRCAYPDGTRVLCASTSQLRDGKIVREVVVQAWDA
jgi:ketosteroid isomerase-like protein